MKRILLFLWLASVSAFGAGIVSPNGLGTNITFWATNSTLFKVPYWKSDSTFNAHTLFYEWSGNLHATYPSILNFQDKGGSAGRIFYWGDESLGSQSLRVGVTAANGGAEPRLTLTVNDVNNDEQHTLRFQTNDLRLAYYSTNENTILRWNNTNLDLTFGNTNSLTSLQGSNVVFRISNLGAVSPANEVGRFYVNSNMSVVRGLIVGSNNVPDSTNVFQVTVPLGVANQQRQAFAVDTNANAYINHGIYFGRNANSSEAGFLLESSTGIVEQNLAGVPKTFRADSIFSGNRNESWGGFWIGTNATEYMVISGKEVDAASENRHFANLIIVTNYFHAGTNNLSSPGVTSLYADATNYHNFALPNNRMVWSITDADPAGTGVVVHWVPTVARGSMIVGSNTTGSATQTGIHSTNIFQVAIPSTGTTPDRKAFEVTTDDKVFVGGALTVGGNQTNAGTLKVTGPVDTPALTNSAQGWNIVLSGASSIDIKNGGSAYAQVNSSGINFPTGKKLNFDDGGSVTAWHKEIFTGSATTNGAEVPASYFQCDLFHSQNPWPAQTFTNSAARGYWRSTGGYLSNLTFGVNVPFPATTNIVFTLRTNVLAAGGGMLPGLVAAGLTGTLRGSATTATFTNVPSIADLITANEVVVLEIVPSAAIKTATNFWWSVEYWHSDP